MDNADRCAKWGKCRYSLTDITALPQRWARKAADEKGRVNANHRATEKAPDLMLNGADLDSRVGARFHRQRRHCGCPATKIAHTSAEQTDT